MAIALLIAKKEGLVSAAEDFAQIRMYFIDPLQHDYEVVRPYSSLAKPLLNAAVRPASIAL
jgi:hypothetical protein